MFDLFCSVTSNDFSLSTNESINLFRKYLYTIEKGNININNTYPFQIKPEIKDEHFLIKQVYHNVPNINELISFQEVMENRNWKISYDI